MAATYDGRHLFWRGPGTFKVKPELHKANREQAVGRLVSLCECKEGVMLLKGGSDRVRDSTDHEELFRQESFFHYLFGVEESGCCGLIDMATCRSVLFVPELPPEHAIWMGNIPTLDVFKAKYGVDDVFYCQYLTDHISQTSPACIHLLTGCNTDSGLTLEAEQGMFENTKQIPIETGQLHRALCDSRSSKTQLEIELMRYVSRISSEAHVEVMRICKPGMMEYQLESTFLHHSYFKGGCRFSSYTSIVGAGEHGAILHYGHSGAPNTGQIQEDGLILCDMGAEYHGYAADITCTFPASGKFTPDQASVYNAVLSAHSTVISSMKPGVSWLDMHVLAERKILGGLKAAGFLRGEVEEMLKNNLGSIFMPHGLGHLLGIDTHDVGGYGYGYPERPKRAGANKLRTARILEENMVITVEPGCYFNDYLMKEALEDTNLSSFLVRERIMPCMKLGGVRIEDNVLITKEGCESFTCVPRTTEEIEALMAGGPWTFK